MRTKLMLILVALCLVSSAAYAGYLTGTIRDIGGNPVEGVTVWSPYSTVQSAADGTYSVDIGQQGMPGYQSNNVFMRKDGYTVPVRFQEDGVNDGVRDFTMSPLGVGREVVDTFNSQDGSYLFGKQVETGGAYQWAGGSDGAGGGGMYTQIQGGAAVLTAGGNYSTIGIGQAADFSKFTPGDFDLTTVISAVDPANMKFMLRYRGSNADGYYYQYAENMTFGWGNSTYPGGIAHASNTLAQYGGPGDGGGIGTAFAPAIDWSTSHTIRLRAVGYETDLWVDGTNVWHMGYTGTTPSYETLYTGYPWAERTNRAPDYTNCPTAPGYIGFANFGAGVKIDSIDIKELVPTSVPEPGSIVALLSGLVGVVGFARRRRA